MSELDRLYHRVRDGLGMPGGSGLSIVEWCTRQSWRWRGRRRRAAIALLAAPAGWEGLERADRILRGIGQ